MVSKTNINYHSACKKQRNKKRRKRMGKRIHERLHYEKTHMGELINEAVNFDMWKINKRYRNSDNKNILNYNMITFLFSLLTIEGLDTEVFKYFTDKDKFKLFSTIPKLKYKIPTIFTSLYKLSGIPIRYLNMVENISIPFWSSYERFRYYMFENVKHIHFGFDFDVTEEMLDKFPKLEHITVGSSFEKDINFATHRNILVTYTNGTIYHRHGNTSALI